MGPRDPYDRKFEGPRLLLRVFEAMTLLISNPGFRTVWKEVFQEDQKFSYFFSKLSFIKA